jgi:hypothetical protein
LIWKFNTGNWVGSSPALADGKVYFGTDGSYIDALNAFNGEVLWQYPTIYGVSSSPAIVDGKVYVGSRDLNVYCLNGTTGAQLWKFKTNAWITCSPAVADGKVYVGEGMHVNAHSRNIYCLDALDGSLIWNFTVNYTGLWVSSSPAVAYGNLYVGSDNGFLYVFGSSQGSAPLPPEITVVTPTNRTYNTSSISCVFTADKPSNWTGYNLDGKGNITITGDFTLTDLPNGLHTLTVYANDTLGNMGASETVSFTVAVPESEPAPFPAVPLVAAVAVVAAVAGVGLLFCFQKRKR